MIKYKECQKNHAAHLGSHVVDGCGEFMPAGENDSSQALRCAACNCHRNFHRREVEGETSAATPSLPLLQLPAPNHPRVTTPNTVNETPVTNCYISFSKQEKIAPLVKPNPTTYTNNGSQRMPVMMAFGAAAESSSDDLNGYRNVEMSGQLMEQYGVTKKRFRTKFTQEQKDKMMEYAEKIGWRIQKQDDVQVQQFCNELGIKRQVFKVWMHNNKQAMKRKQS